MQFLEASLLGLELRTRRELWQPVGLVATSPGKYTGHHGYEFLGLEGTIDALAR
jgi:hypothetical protein